MELPLPLVVEVPHHWQALACLCYVVPLFFTSLTKRNQLFQQNPCIRESNRAGGRGWGRESVARRSDDKTRDHTWRSRSMPPPETLDNIQT